MFIISILFQFILYNKLFVFVMYRMYINVYIYIYIYKDNRMYCMYEMLVNKRIIHNK
jgi:hypothetical protein